METVHTWVDEALGVRRDVARALERTVAEAVTTLTAAATDDTTVPTPVAALARIGDLARTTAFLWAETGLLARERLSRAARVGGVAALSEDAAADRATLLATVAADVYGGYDLLRARARRWPALAGRRDWDAQHGRGAGRIRDTAESLGGVLIKGCQFASTRPDLLPRAYLQAFAPLQDRMPARPWPTIEATITRELGWPAEAVFETIGPAPIAAASLAQVHRARLRGVAAAVKVQYPGVADVIAADLAALGQIAARIARAEPTVRLDPVLNYLRATLPLELDFRREASAMTDLQAALAHREDVRIPLVLAPATERLLVMEWIDGVKVTDRAGLIAAGIEPGAVARLLIDVYAEQILKIGLLHADPHPGNLLVQPGPRLVLLDHGLTVQLEPIFVAALVRMVRAVLRGNWHALPDLLADAGLPVEGLDVTALLDLAGAAVRADRLDLGALNDLASRLGNLPFELMLIGRALVMIEGTIRALDPDVDILEMLARYV